MTNGYNAERNIDSSSLKPMTLSKHNNQSDKNQHANHNNNPEARNVIQAWHSTHINTHQTSKK
jgi:hypothetical protein